MTSVADLHDQHKGRPVAIIGGGPSLPSHVEGLPADTIYMGVNRHGHHARDEGLIPRVDYCVHLDKALARTLAALDVPVISSFVEYADYWFAKQSDALDEGFTPSTAVWLALFMGASEVILCGMDCYTGTTYWHDADATSSGSLQPLNRHLNGWKRVLDKCPNAERISTMGGPTSRLFPLYAPPSAPST